MNQEKDARKLQNTVTAVNVQQAVLKRPTDALAASLLFYVFNLDDGFVFALSIKTLKSILFTGTDAYIFSHVMWIWLRNYQRVQNVILQQPSCPAQLP